MTLTGEHMAQALMHRQRSKKRNRDEKENATIWWVPTPVSALVAVKGALTQNV